MTLGQHQLSWPRRRQASLHRDGHKSKHVIVLTLKLIGARSSNMNLGHIKRLCLEVERNLDSLFDIMQILDRVSLMKFNAVSGINDKSMQQNT